MESGLTKLSNAVRLWMRIPAAYLNKISHGKITPNHITFVSLLGHVPIVWALWNNMPLLAAVLLAFFGLMDSLDGALARIQHSSSLQGMFNDATSDRLKEVMIYTGLTAYLLLYIDTEQFVWLPTAVLGGSLLVSYIKAKGEMAVSGLKSTDPQQLNRVFADGFGRYEVRMLIIILGLVSTRVVLSLWVLLVIVLMTALQRYMRIRKVLSHV